MTASSRGGAAGRRLADEGCSPWTLDRSAAGPQESCFALGKFILPSAAWPVVQVLNAFKQELSHGSAEGFSRFADFFFTEKEITSQHLFTALTSSADLETSGKTQHTKRIFHE